MTLTLDPEDTLNRIHQLAWGGFVRLGDIGWLIEDEYLEPGTLTDADRAWIQSHVGEAVASKAAAEAAWPPRTTYDRLDEVFVALRETGFIALHRAGNSRAEGLEEVRRIFFESGGIDSGLVAFCFYHAQDVDDAVASGCLRLAFGAIGKTSDGQREERNTEVGRTIMQTLRTCAFSPSWSGDVAQRIVIPVDPWHKRSPSASDTVRER
ncbi:hypothetical protein [Variovorax sp. OV700]|uniref:DUF6891 domain-containing protein n=1 Tax=Variovorax sp. OV700 TaxID=1882826 RepID=UPI0008813955|nr:hypothetical protein [Variovorax sp. OV700]SDH94063.1 hypothetical protein SAMN05444748_10328 [Variovorax sp. OV700]